MGICGYIVINYYGAYVFKCRLHDDACLHRICRLRESRTWERFAAAVKEAAGVAGARGGALPAGEQRPRCAVLGDSTPVAALAASETGIGTVTALQVQIPSV
jgi:hypothetical protein